MKVVKDGEEVEFVAPAPSGKRVIKFTASWCAPCKRVHPYYIGLAGKHVDLDFCVCDVDDEATSALVAEYNVKSLPTFVFATSEQADGKVAWKECTNLRVEGSNVEAMAASVKAHAA